MKINGKGSIVQIDKGNKYRCTHWLLQVSTDKGRKTRRFQGSVSESKAALQEFMDELSGVDPDSPLFGEYAQRWVDLCAATGAYSPNTTQRRRSNLKRAAGYIRKPVREITRSDVMEMVAGLLDDGCSKTTAGTVLGTVRTCLNSAVDDGIIQSNPCNGVKPPKRDTKEVDPLSKSELEAILDAIDARRHITGHCAAYYLMITLGLRSEEALALTWDCVGDDSVRIVKALKVSTMTVEDCKSKSSVRELAMPPRLKEFLNRWKAVEWPGDRVCPGRGGSQLHPSNLRRWAHQNGFPTRFHLLRHSYLTELARSGCTPYVLQKIAGWSDIKMAMVYCKVDYGDMKAAALKVSW